MNKGEYPMGQKDAW